MKRNVVRMWAAVSREECCVTKLKAAARETNYYPNWRHSTKYKRAAMSCHQAELCTGLKIVMLCKTVYNLIFYSLLRTTHCFTITSCLAQQLILLLSRFRVVNRFSGIIKFLFWKTSKQLTSNSDQESWNTTRHKKKKKKKKMIRGTSHFLPGFTKEATSYLVGSFDIRQLL